MGVTENDHLPASEEVEKPLFSCEIYCSVVPKATQSVETAAAGSRSGSAAGDAEGSAVNCSDQVAIITSDNSLFFGKT